MALVCHILVASLCVAAPRGFTEVRVNEGGLGPITTLRHGEVWEAQRIQNAVVRKVNPTKLAQACQDGDCVGYIRQCDSAMKSCDYVFDGPGHDAIPIWLSLKDPTAMAEAGANLGFVKTFRDGKPVALPFSLFTQEGNVEAVLCVTRLVNGQRVADAGCELLPAP